VPPAGASPYTTRQASLAATDDNQRPIPQRRTVTAKDIAASIPDIGAGPRDPMPKNDGE
jgi:hypothetical protein